MVGLGWTPEKTAHFFPEMFSRDLKASVRTRPGSVTINGLFDAERLQVAWQILEAAGAEPDVRGKGETCCHFMK